MKRFLNILQSAEALGLILFSLIILRSILTKTVDQTEFTVNVFFWISRLIELDACIIAFNSISTRYYRLALPASAIALMSFINECLHIFNIVELNNQYLLTFEFIILLIFLWLISKIYSTLS